MTKETVYYEEHFQKSNNADGTRIAFVSNRNLTGGNADGNQEIFLAMGGGGSPALGIPTMTQWGMIIFVILAGLGAVYYLRRQTAER